MECLATLSVPFLVSVGYDFRGFIGFGTRVGLCGDHLRVVASLPPAQLAALAQAWLFFGLLAEFTGRPVALDAWKKQEETDDQEGLQSAEGRCGATLDVSGLEELLKEWTNCVLSLDETAREDALAHAYECLVVAVFVLDRCPARHEKDDQELDEVLLSIRVLVAILAAYLNGMSPRDIKADDMPWLEYM